VLLAWGSASGSAKAAGIWGDLASFLAAVAFCGYITVGRDLRSWMPIFVYTFPVTFTAALLLSLAGLAIDRHEFIGASHQGILGWTTSAHYAPYVVYLALGPGLVGHTGFNTLLRYMTTLTISLACQLETVMAPLIGWLLSVSAMPESVTYIGGAIVLAATMIVTVASNRRQQQEEARQAGFVALGSMFQTYSALQTDDMDALQGGMDDQLADDGEDWVAKA
jgi:drug/metabolite transporter (DMT)-like permease